MRKTNRHRRMSPHLLAKVNPEYPRTKHIVAKLEEVLPPVRNRTAYGPYMLSRACNVNEKLGKLTSYTGKLNKPKEKHQNVPQEEYNFDPILPDTVDQRELKRMLYDFTARVDNASQYVNVEPICEPNVTSSDNICSGSLHLDTIDNVEAVIIGAEHEQRNQNYLQAFVTNNMNVMNTKHEEPVTTHPKKIHITDVPRIKFIAEKFSRFKKNDIEVRKLNEKIVCVEYDVFEVDDLDQNIDPVQILRAFFSIKPPAKEANAVEATLKQIPSAVRQKYQIAEEDLNKLDDKEIEIIDETIAENKPYLDDLKRILKRKQKSAETALDLQYLYELAKRETPPSDYDFSKLLSEAELNEVKGLILKRCVSSFHGISRRFIRKERVTPEKEKDIGVITKSTILNLLQDYKNKDGC